MEEEEPQVLSLGLVIDGSRQSSKAWGEAVQRVMKRVSEAREGFRSPLNLNVVFHVSGDIMQAEFVGIRTGIYSKRLRLLMIQVALPDNVEGDLECQVVDRVNDAIAEAERFVQRRGIADPPLAALREIVESLGQGT